MKHYLFYFQGLKSKPKNAQHQWTSFPSNHDTFIRWKLSTVKTTMQNWEHASQIWHRVHVSFANQQYKSTCCTKLTSDTMMSISRRSFLSVVISWSGSRWIPTQQPLTKIFVVLKIISALICQHNSFFKLKKILLVFFCCCCCFVQSHYVRKVIAL